MCKGLSLSDLGIRISVGGASGDLHFTPQQNEQSLKATVIGFFLCAKNQSQGFTGINPLYPHSCNTVRSAL